MIRLCILHSNYHCRSSGMSHFQCKKCCPSGSESPWLPPWCHHHLTWGINSCHWVVHLWRHMVETDDMNIAQEQLGHNSQMWENTWIASTWDPRNNELKSKNGSTLQPFSITPQKEPNSTWIGNWDVAIAGSYLQTLAKKKVWAKSCTKHPATCGASAVSSSRLDRVFPFLAERVR